MKTIRLLAVLLLASSAGFAASPTFDAVTAGTVTATSTLVAPSSFTLAIGKVTGLSADVTTLLGAADYAAFKASLALIPTGGTTGQALTKTSATNYATSWTSVLTPAAIGASVQGWSNTLDKLGVTVFATNGLVYYTTAGPGGFGVAGFSGLTLSGGTLSVNNVSLASGVTGTLPVANGGTGQTTASAAINALVPTQTGNSGKVLQTNGSAVSWQSPSGGGTAAKLVNVTGASARHALTGAEVNVGDIVRTQLSALSQESYDITVDFTFPTPGQVVLDFGDNNFVYAVVDGIGDPPPEGSSYAMNFDSTTPDADGIAISVAGGINAAPLYFSAVAEGPVVHITSTYPSDRNDLSLSAVGGWSLTGTASYSPASYEKHLVIDTAHLDSDALGFAKFAND